MGQCGSLQPTVVIWPLTVPAPKGLRLSAPAPSCTYEVCRVAQVYHLGRQPSLPLSSPT